MPFYLCEDIHDSHNTSIHGYTMCVVQTCTDLRELLQSNSRSMNMPCYHSEPSWNGLLHVWDAHLLIIEIWYWNLTACHHASKEALPIAMLSDHNTASPYQIDTIGDRQLQSETKMPLMKHLQAWKWPATYAMHKECCPWLALSLSCHSSSLPPQLAQLAWDPACWGLHR